MHAHPRYRATEVLAGAPGVALDNGETGGGGGDGNGGSGGVAGIGGEGGATRSAEDGLAVPTEVSAPIRPANGAVEVICVRLAAAS